MSGFIKGEDRSQATLFPERLDDYVAEDSAVRVIDVFLDDLDLSGLRDETCRDQRKPHNPDSYNTFSNHDRFLAVVEADAPPAAPKERRGGCLGRLTSSSSETYCGVNRAFRSREA
jgi:hypothetical protein